MRVCTIFFHFLHKDGRAQISAAGFVDSIGRYLHICYPRVLKP